MRNVLIMSGILMMSCVVFADDTTTTETCANGAGTVITGAVSGHKYCLRKSTHSGSPTQIGQIIWWNAHTWCEGIGRTIFSMNDCGCNATINCNNKCPELAIGGGGLSGQSGIWTDKPFGTSGAYVVNLTTGTVSTTTRYNEFGFVLCK